jgi:hypothetical protein
MMFIQPRCRDFFNAKFLQVGEWRKEIARKSSRAIAYLIASQNNNSQKTRCAQSMASLCANGAFENSPQF